MGRFPRIADLPIPRDEKGRTLCRQCCSLVPKGRRAYCSNRCMRLFFQSHSWTHIRKDMLRRSRGRCAICGLRKSKRFLDVDHIIPVHMGGDLFDKDNLRVLCKECHKAKTKLDRQALNGVS